MHYASLLWAHLPSGIAYDPAQVELCSSLAHSEETSADWRLIGMIGTPQSSRSRRPQIPKQRLVFEALARMNEGNFNLADARKRNLLR